MKKTVFLVGLVLLAVAGVFAQMSMEGKTYYYRYVETVDPDTGMKSLDRNIHLRENSNNIHNVPTWMYITFTRNSCYASDNRGIAIRESVITPDGLFDGIIPYLYQGEQNNMFVFLGKTPNNRPIMDTCYLYFSKDYKRINFKASRIVLGYGDSYKKNIYIYEQADPPQPEPPKQDGPKAPTQMW
jgi:hypothetical protein